MVRTIIVTIGTVAAFCSAGVAQQVTLYDFYSPTCGPCRRMEPVVHQLTAAGYPVRKVNIMGSPDEQALAAKFRVQKVPTFITAVDGRQVDRILGPTSYSHLEQIVRRARQVAQDLQPPENPVASRMQSPDQQARTNPSSNLWDNPPGRSSRSEQTPQVQAWPTENQTPRVGPNVGDRRSISPAATNQADADLLRSTVRLRVEDGNSHSWGTGTIIDARSGEALIITCGHIFRDSKGKGPVSVELFAVTPGGVRVSERVAGHVISFDLDRDIGMVSIRPKQTVRVAPVASSGANIAKQGRVASVGCDHGDNPTVRHSHISALNRYLGEPNIEVAGAPVEGRSGGGLFNDSGELIGICNAADPEGNEGLFAGLPSVHQELADIGLSEIYRNAQSSQPPTQLAATNPLPAPRANSIDQQSQAVQPLQSIGPPKTISIASPDIAQSTGKSRANTVPLSPVEQAAWEEIMGRATEAEIVCIIRPKTPGGKSEVITLSNVSTEFVRRLVDQQVPKQSPRPATAPTSYPVSH